MPRVLKLRPHAKINLLLRVGPMQPSGYHDVCTVLQAIGISDTITFTKRRGPFTLQARSADVPKDRDNLVWRAAELLWRAAGQTGEPRNVHVKLEKAIPVAAGLGGGSADAAAALVGLNKVWDFDLSRRELAGLATTLGADVPFFLVGGTAVGIGRGDTVFPLLDAERLGLVIIKPSFGVSTSEAYRWLDADRAAGLPAAERPFAEVSLGWPSGPMELRNDLEGPVMRRHPALGEIVDACRRAGALTAAMSGSGSAVFGVFSHRIAPHAARRLRRPDWLVLATRTLSRAESNRQMGL